jgi:uncharacterized protein (TIGR02996 family)
VSFAHAAFLEQIAAAPDDAGPYLVYADALQAAGDPRGDLISIQHALESPQSPAAACELRSREAALLDAHADEWFGALRDPSCSLQVRWKRGFLHAARVDLDEGGRTLRALLDTPGVAHTLAELRLGPAYEKIERPDGEPFLPLLREKWPASLRRLYLYDGDPLAARPPTLSLEALDGVALDTLVAWADDVVLGWRAPIASLRWLEIRARAFDARRLALPAPWPALEHLVVGCDDPTALDRVAGASNVPRLRALGVVGTAHTDRVIAELATARIADRLDELDVSRGTLTDGGARALAAAVPRTLRRLDASRNLLSKDAAAALIDALPSTTVDVRGQRRGMRSMADPAELVDRHERYDQAAESILARSDNPLKRYRALRAKIASADPAWGASHCVRLFNQLSPADRRAAATELVAELEAQLAAILLARADDLYDVIGSACDELGELHAAEAWLWRAVMAARWTGSERDEIRALAHVGTLRMRRGDAPTAAPLLARVAAFYREQREKRGEGWALRQQGNCELMRSEFAKAEVFYRSALELLRETQSKVDEAAVLSELAGVLWSRQDFDGAEQLIRESIAMRGPDELGTASAYYNLGAVLNGVGRLDEARAAGERALAIFRARRHRHGEGQALSLLGELAQRRNDHAAALELLEAAIARHREVGVVREHGIALGNLSRVHLDLGNFDDARACLHEALELDRECNNKYNEGLAILGLADAALGDGDLEDAARLADEAIEPLAAIANYPAIAACRLHRGYAFHLAGNLDEAELLYRAAIVDAERGRYPELIGWTALWMAVLAAPRDPAEAAEHLVVAESQLRDSIQGSEALAVARAVVARLDGTDPGAVVPSAVGLTSRLLARLVD